MGSTSESPRTVVEIADYSEVTAMREAGEAMPHKSATVRVNGHPVRLAPNGIKIDVRDAVENEGTTVTLILQPDEIHFI